ncbi:MAG: M23 family metallopeptidase [Candidatus Krumholzibacteria bacterium]|nr:M23 family metallopeptidase [Candidatus Krumholzibacteria bacterium]
MACSGILLTAAWISPLGAAEPDSTAIAPRWPLDLPTRYLTSNFMEYRSGRFHAGLDLKTCSQTGFAARAVEDGCVVRVRATPFAYGRAVYLLGNSGRTYVYAHLSRFSDPIRAMVRARQVEAGTYRVRLQFKPGEMAVRRGDVIGLTGESGTNGPHLHFEVRDVDNGPVNPLAMGFVVPDTFPPIIHAVRAVPAAFRSRIDGEPTARLLKPEGAGTCGLTGELPQLQVAGPVAFAAKIIDAADIRDHKLEPWLIEVRLDGDVVYRCRNDRYDFSENSLQRLEWLEVPGIRDHWLHRRSANSLTGRQGGEWYLGPDGAGLAPGSHVLEILAADFAGNETSVSIPLLAADVDFPQPPSRGAWLGDPVSVALNTLSDNNLHPFAEVNNEAQMRSILHFSPDNGDPVLEPMTLAVVHGNQNKKQRRQAGKQGLEVAFNPAYSSVSFLAADWPIDAALVVRYLDIFTDASDTLLPEKDPAVMVYRWSKDEWKPAGRLIEPEYHGAGRKFALSSPGQHSVFRDVATPMIFPADTVITVAADPRGQIHGVTLPSWEIFPVGLLDLGSGIAPESIIATLDGQPIIVEPDLPRDRVLVELPDELAVGRHVLHLKAADEAENEAEAEVLIDCRE